MSEGARRGSTSVWSFCQGGIKDPGLPLIHLIHSKLYFLEHILAFDSIEDNGYSYGNSDDQRCLAKLY